MSGTGKTLKARRGIDAALDFAEKNNYTEENNIESNLTKNKKRSEIDEAKRKAQSLNSQYNSKDLTSNMARIMGGKKRKNKSKKNKSKKSKKSKRKSMKNKK